MKKMSRLLALVMALVLALGTFTTAMAEESNGFSVSDLTKGVLENMTDELGRYYATQFYAELMATTTEEDFNEVKSTHPVFGDWLFSYMTDEQMTDLYAHNVELSAVNGEAIAYSADGVAVNAPAGAFPSGTEANVAAVTDETVLAALATAIAAVDDTAAIVDAYDISFNYTALGVTDEVQPYTDTTVPLTFTVADADLGEDCTGLAVYHMVEDGNGGYTAELVGESELVEDAAEQTITVEGSTFSIYVVTGGTGENHYNYKILMSVGDTLELTSTNATNNGNWTLASGDTANFSLSDSQGRTTDITARSAGTVTVRYGSNETITVTALPAAGSEYDNDIIFANIRLPIDASDDEYTNTYGPYVMKIRFEDTEGNLLNMGDDYYVFDSACNIDINTFAASAPSGMTYAGSFFYWTSHNDFDGAKVYVTSVTRNDSLAYGSYLWYSGTHDTSGQGSWAYQASGVLHVVYAPVDEVHTITFKDHCGYELANYALNHNDSAGGIKFPSGYVANIDNMANTLIPNHHNSHDSGYDFTGNWVVSGGGSGIDGTYATTQLKNVITTWSIKGNIVITAQCSEPEVTIYYKPVTDGAVSNVGGSVNPVEEKLAIQSGDAAGSTATANENYEFKGWYSDQACTNQVGDAAFFDPTKPDTGWVDGTTYYAKFELAVAPLIITKNVTDADTTDSVTIDPNQVFKFNITIGETAYSGNPISLKNGESVTIRDITIGTAYAVEEIEIPVGYENTTAGLDEEGKLTGTIVAGETTNTVTFTNTLKVADLTIDKTITGADANTADDTFTFNATIGGAPYTGKYNIGDEEYTATNGAIVITESQTATIKDIPINTAYIVTEAAYPTGYNVADGSAPAAQSGMMDADGQNVTFTNEYTTNTLTITKAITNGDDNTADDVFTFNVTLPTGTYAVEGTTDKYTVAGTANATSMSATAGTPVVVTITGASSVVIKGIPTGASYTVSEEELPNGYTLAPLTGDEGELSENKEAKFTNLYATGTLDITKKVNGADAPDDEFEFTVNLYTDANKSAAQVGSFSYTIDDNNAQTTNVTGTISNGGTVKLKKDHTVTITGIPTSTYYEVTETTIPADYTLESKTNDAGSISSTVASEAEFTNKYLYSHLTVTKSGLSGTESAIVDVTVGGKTFNLVLNSANGWTQRIDHLPIDDSYTVSEDPNWAWRYEDVPSIAYNPESKLIVEGGATVTVTNSTENTKWLSDETSTVNNFTAVKND